MIIKNEESKHNDKHNEAEKTGLWSRSCWLCLFSFYIDPCLLNLKAAAACHRSQEVFSCEFNSTAFDALTLSSLTNIHQRGGTNHQCNHRASWVKIRLSVCEESPTEMKIRFLTNMQLNNPSVFCSPDHLKIKTIFRWQSGHETESKYSRKIFKTTISK